MSSLLGLSSPLIGSWSDQPMDKTQMTLMEQTAAAANARRAAQATSQQVQMQMQMQQQQAAAAGHAAAAASPQPPHPSSASPPSHTQGKQATPPPPSSAAATATGAAAGTTSPVAAAAVANGSAAESADSESAAAAPVFGPFNIDPHAAMSARYNAAVAAAAASAASDADGAGGPAGGWGVTGKLKAMARSVFERAWGLNGRAQESHESLCEEICLSAQCSRKSFCELIYGHSYAADLTDLRALVPGYRPKVARKRDAAERGRGGRKKNGEASEGEGAGEEQQAHAHAHASEPAAATAAASGPASPAGARPMQTQLHSPAGSMAFLSRGQQQHQQSPLRGAITVQQLSGSPAQYSYNGQPIMQHPIIHLTHRLIPSVHNQQQQTGAAPQPLQPLQPVPNARFAPPPPNPSSRRASPAPSPMLKPVTPLLAPGSGSMSSPNLAPLSAPQLAPRRSVDASSAMRAAVAAAHSVSPHLASLGDPTLNPPLPIVPISPSLAPVTGKDLKAQMQAKVVGSPLRQSMNAQMAAAVMSAGSANLPPRASPSLNALRAPYTQAPVPSQVQSQNKVGFAFPSPLQQQPATQVPRPLSAPLSPSVPFTFSTGFSTKASSAAPEDAAAAVAPSAAAAAVAAPAASGAPVAVAASVAAPTASSSTSPKSPSTALSADTSAPLSGSHKKKRRGGSSSDEHLSVSPVPEEDAGSSALSASEKKRAKKLRTKEKRKREAEAEAAAATAKREEMEAEERRAVAASGKRSPPTPKQQQQQQQQPQSLQTKQRRKFSATPPNSPPLYALTLEKATAASSSGGAAIGATRAAQPQSSSMVQLLLLTAVGTALFAVTRCLLGTVLFDASDSSSTPVWGVLAALYSCTLFLFVWLLRAAHEASAVWGAVVLELSCQLEKYVATWSLLAVDDPAQLLAAINQVQQLLDAALAAFSGLACGGWGGVGGAARLRALEALDHGVDVMDFLHLAHRNLIAELGSTQPIMRLVASLGAVRSKLMHVRSKMPAPPPRGAFPPLKGKAAVAAASSSLPPVVLLVLSLTAINLLLLLVSPPLTSPALNTLLPLGLVLLLCLLALVVWGAQSPFAGPPGSAASFPSAMLGVSAGASMLVSLEPLLYLRSRLGEKEAEARQHVQHPSHDHAAAHALAQHGLHDHEEEEEEEEAHFEETD